MVSVYILEMVRMLMDIQTNPSRTWEKTRKIGTIQIFSIPQASSDHFPPLRVMFNEFKPPDVDAVEGEELVKLKGFILQ